MRLPPQHVAAGVLLGAVLAVVLSVALPSWGSRNTSGTYTLPAGNPVVPGTPISSSWANSTLADIGTELTDSLSRSGKGGMGASAALKLADGTAALPALSFNTDVDTGLFHPAANAVTLALGGNTAQAWTATGSTIAGALTTGSPVQVGTTTPLTLRNVASPVVGFNTVDTGSGAVRISAGFVHDIAQSGGDVLFRTGGTGAAGPVTMSARASFSENGLRIGETGTPISGSFGATFNIDFVNTTVGACNAVSQPLTGVAPGGVCSVTPESVVMTAGCRVIACDMTAADAVLVRFCNCGTAAVDPPSHAFYVRVWQP